MWAISRTVEGMTMVAALAACTVACRGAKPVADEPVAPQATTPERQARAAPPAVGDLGKVGRVEYKLACAPAVQADFDRGLALLHSFFYREARKSFEAVVASDPDCAAGHWGVAMSWYHPIWAAPTPEELEAGKRATRAAVAAGKKTPRDEMLIASVVAFYEADEASSAHRTGQSCHGPSGAHPARARAFADQLAAAYAAFPDDIEVASFYALALLGSAPPVDPQLTHQKRAAAILEPWWARRQDHPGVPHYLIHAYDYPSLASKGLAAARAYAAIAPHVPHVLHMPSHIFVRLGMWTENIDSNLASAEAARAVGAEDHPGAIGFEELHALDYLVYGYLQTGQEAKARAIAERVPAIMKVAPENAFVSSYAFAAIPARYAVERQDWAAAAALQVPDMPFWSKFPFTEAHIEYARGLGRARSGDVGGARQSMTRLRELRERTTDPAFAYFEKHVALQIQALGAWIAHAEKRDVAAIKMMREAAVAEDKHGKHPVSPGPVYPIYDQLGALLLETGQAKEALAAFEAALATSPRRFNSLYGAGKAAMVANQPDVARRYFDQLVAMAPESDRREVAEAKAFVGR